MKNAPIAANHSSRGFIRSWRVEFTNNSGSRILVQQQKTV